MSTKGRLPAEPRSILDPHHLDSIARGDLLQKIKGVTVNRLLSYDRLACFHSGQDGRRDGSHSGSEGLALNHLLNLRAWLLSQQVNCFQQSDFPGELVNIRISRAGIGIPLNVATV